MTALALATLPASSQGLTVSGGLDLRASTGTDGSRAVLEGAFLNLRQVLSQGGADRWAFVLQGDSGENAESPHLYQAYGEWKGPLGRWKVRAGRFLVPFGLLSQIDTERMLLNTQEPLTLGLKLDEGLLVQGFTPSFDYAVALTNGLRNQGPVWSGRLGHEREAFTVGLSWFIGKLPETASKESVELPNHVLEGMSFVRKRRLGLDGTWNLGPTLLRAELVAGRDGDSFVRGAYLEGERALSSEWSLTMQAGHWRGTEDRRRIGAGVAYTLGHGVTLRAAALREWVPEGRGNAVMVQFYKEFSHAW